MDGRTDGPRPPRQCFMTNFLSRPVFSHGPPTLRPRKEVINPQEVNPPRGLTVLLSRGLAGEAPLYPFAITLRDFSFPLQTPEMEVGGHLIA